jgi:O-antigen ligase
MKAQATPYTAPLIAAPGRMLAAVALGIITVTVFDLGGHSTYVPRWLAVHFCAALAAFDLALSVSKAKQLRLDIVDVAGLGFLLWCALSLAWSSDPRVGAPSLVHIAALLLVFAWVRRQPDDEREFLLQVLFCGAAIVALVFAVIWPSKYGGFGNRNFITEFLLTALAFPAFLAGSETRGLKLFGLGLAGAILVYLLGFNDSKIEFFVVPGVVLLVSATILYRRLGASRFSLLAAATLAVPAVVAWMFWNRMGFDVSTMFRFELLTNSTLLWLESPIWGHGLGGFDFEYPRVQERHLSVFPWLQTVMFADMRITAGAAHNDILQGLTELGLVGMAILGFAAYRIARAYVAKPSKSLVDHMAAAAAVALLLCAQLEFPLQNPATAFAGAVLAGHLGARPVGAPARFVIPLGRLARRLPLLATIIALPALIWVDRRVFIAEKYYLESGSLTLLAKPDLAIGRLMMAYDMNPFERQIRQQLFITLMGISEAQRQLPLSIAEMDGYYRISASAGPLWPALVMARLAMLLGTEEIRQTRAPEIAALFNEARAALGHQPNLHILDASDALRNQDWPRARAAIDKGLSLIQTTEPQRQAFLRMRQALPAAAR